MDMCLFDTNILIDHLKGRQEATDILTSCITTNKTLLCSVITVTELLCGVKPDEEEQLEYFLSGFKKIDVTGDIAEIAGRYLNKYRKSHGMNMADAIIAATAKLTGSKLYTLNTKHYPMSDIEAIKPY